MTIKSLLSKLILYIICIFFWVTANAQDNITVIDSLISEIFIEQFSGPDRLSGDTLYIVSPDSAGDFRRYAGFILTGKLQNSGFKVFRNGSTQGTVLELAHTAVAIRYSEPYSSSLFGRDMSKRHITVKLIGQIRNEPSGLVVRSIEVEKTFSDEIKYNNIEELEASSYSFTQGEREKYSNWDKIVEPALIISSIVVIVLLFFTQRA